MEKHSAIPQGYMTVGEIAKKMGITVRTMRHYDKAGLLSPSSESEGGYRLYSYKDMVKLNQILSMKYLGFSLDDIKNRLIALDTPEEVAHALSEHAAAIRKKMEMLLESLNAVEALKAEVVQMRTVDFKKYADIVVSLQMKNENYWAIKHLDNDLLDQLRSRYDQDKNGALAITETMERMEREGVRLQEEGVSPESEKGLVFAQAVWDMTLEFTDGDLKLISKLADMREKISFPDREREEKFMTAHNFMRAALEAYFIKLGHDPFE